MPAILTDKQSELIELLERIKQSNLTEQMKLIKLIYEQLQKGQILIWMRDGELAASVQRSASGWKNGLPPS